MLTFNSQFSFGIELNVDADFGDEDVNAIGIVITVSEGGDTLNHFRISREQIKAILAVKQHAMQIEDNLRRKAEFNAAKEYLKSKGEWDHGG